MAQNRVLKQTGKNPGAARLALPVRQAAGRQVCVLTSGGADSSILLVAMTERYARVIPVYVRNGLVWEKAELYWLRRFLKAVDHPAIGPLQVLDLPMKDVYGAHWSMTGTAVPDDASGWEEVYLPGRNLILLAKTAVFCGLNDINAIALGPLKTNLFADSSPEFFSGFGQSVERAIGRRIEILTPFSHLSKQDVMERGRPLPLDLTFSCLSPQGKMHCGACNKCAERAEAFADARLLDRTRYMSAAVRSMQAGIPKAGRPAGQAMETGSNKQ